MDLREQNLRHLRAGPPMSHCRFISTDGNLQRLTSHTIASLQIDQYLYDFKASGRREPYLHSTVPRDICLSLNFHPSISCYLQPFA